MLMLESTVAGSAPRDLLIVHPLPKAKTFIGRERELETLDRFWEAGRGVLSLVGFGGAGKTAILDRFLDRLESQGGYDGILVWSFYDDPDTNAFLRTAVSYFKGGEQTQANGAGWFYLLSEALSSGGRYLIVLDGLERVQRPQTDASGIYGALEDPLLRGLLVRLASGTGSSKALITSRFPISDLDKFAGKGYGVLDINLLEEPAALGVLRSHGAKGTDEDLRGVLEMFGRHALTVDLLGSAIRSFHGGSPQSLPRVSLEGVDEGDRLSVRLASVLRMYEEGLSESELDLVSRLCVFRFGVDMETLSDIFLEGDAGAVSGTLAALNQSQLQDLLKVLEDCHLIYREGKDRFTIHPAVRDYFYGTFRDSARIHGALTRHLMTLSGRPGVGLPTDKDALDLLEELIFHAVKAGNVEEAAEIYNYRLGGNDHLNVRLGEYARTHRILKAFPECPDPGAMYHCLRAFGRFEEALLWRPKNTYILTIGGDLQSLRQGSSPNAKKVAAFLQGQDASIPERAPDNPLPPSFLHLIKNDLDRAWEACRRELEVSMHQDDLVRNQLVMAEVLRRRGQLKQSEELLTEASEWVLRAGSEEHLCLMHLLRGRLGLSANNLTAARSSLVEANQVAEDCGFSVLQALVANDLAKLSMAQGDMESALERCDRAIEACDEPRFSFAWGKVQLQKTKTDILLRLSRVEEAIATLEMLSRKQLSLGDPEASDSTRTLMRLKSRLA
jgi:tetratricopeptide (TPR) repeat protein